MESERSRWGFCWLLMVCLLSWSCSSDRGDGPELHKVAGRVTLDGQPLRGARVLFTPGGGGRPAMGLTDDAGRYKLAWTATGMGTPAGEYVVSVSTYRAEEEDSDTGAVIPSSPETVPASYNRGSTLRIAVPGGSYDIELESGGEIVQPMPEAYGRTAAGFEDRSVGQYGRLARDG